jgi:VCBS repeat-containing protein
MDDSPIAHADLHSVAQDDVSASGNVFAGDAFGGAADQIGADGAHQESGHDHPVVGLVAGDNTGNPAVIGDTAADSYTVHGTYGDLTLNADGSYEYTRNADPMPKDATDTFTYTIMDGDGDTSTATLTINGPTNLSVTPVPPIPGGPEDPGGDPNYPTPDPGGNWPDTPPSHPTYTHADMYGNGHLVLSEAYLAGGTQHQAGDPATVSGSVSFTIASDDGLATVKIGTDAYTVENGALQESFQVIDNGTGTFTDATLTDNHDGIYTLTLDYTQYKAFENTDIQGANIDPVANLEIAVTTLDGTTMTTRTGRATI